MSDTRSQIGDARQQQIRELAVGPSDAIDYKALTYDEWLYLQHLWLWERLGVDEGDPLAVTAAALDKITRLPVNGRGSDAYWTARMALARAGAWPLDADDNE